ncbi:MAG TPA: carboxyltransferase domain-containing protein [Thermoleophilia bacterium]|nr:carboxyltransferase domain-containing protein [Thermoleophilia bacterium]
MTVDEVEEVSPAVVGTLSAIDGRPQVTYRLAGDSYLLLEYGDLVLDLTSRVRVHSLERAIHALHAPGIIETAPGVRSLLICYDCLKLRLPELIEMLAAIEVELPPAEDMELPSRVVHLPIACHDRWTAQAVAKYADSVRAEAPYVPDNMEFIARCNGLEGSAEVEEYVMATQHLVIGLGDVYLGAPCAVPLDPRRRLVVPKYNPARTWTPEGAVGIGGAYLCIYPMESPGGYQLFGRTLPIWNTMQSTRDFAEAPWLLRFFDRIQFEPVSEDELETLRAAMLDGGHAVRIEEGTFSVAEYCRFLDQVSDEATAFKNKQDEAVVEATVGY